MLVQERAGRGCGSDVWPRIILVDVIGGVLSDLLKLSGGEVQPVVRDSEQAQVPQGGRVLESLDRAQYLRGAPTFHTEVRVSVIPTPQCRVPWLCHVPYGVCVW